MKLTWTSCNDRTSIEATIKWKLTNRISEADNATIGRIRSAALGFHEPESFSTMIMVVRGGIARGLMAHETVRRPVFLMSGGICKYVVGICKIF